MRIVPGLLLLATTTLLAQSSAAPPLHVLKITSGPAGIESQGTFVLTEERSVFSRTSDREVIVLFQWDGVPGPHKLVAQWRSPDGGLTSTSTVDYVARDRRFGGYWRLTIAPTMPLGTWTIEVTVDGQPAGRHTFEVRDEKVGTAVAKRPLAPPELYERLNRMFVVLERATADGQQLEPAGGLLGNGGRIYTSLAAIDATDVVRAVAADGSRRALGSVLAMNRSQDWAVLGDGPQHEASLPVAAPDTVKIGDRCYSIEGATVGGRVLAEGSITGQGELPGAGRRLLAGFLTTGGTPGAPVLNEYGELIGVIGGGPIAGANRLMDTLRFRAELKGTPIIPFTAFRVQEQPADETLAALQQRGQLIAPLSGSEHVVSGGFARSIEKRNATPVDQKDLFSVGERTFAVFITWNPRQRLRGQVQFRVYDAANRLQMESKPSRADYRKDQFINTHWVGPLPSPPGLYRVDIVFNDRPAWRGFFRVID